MRFFFTPQKCLRQSEPGPAALPRQTRSWVGITPGLLEQTLGALAKGEAGPPPLSFWGVLSRSHIREPPHTSPMGQEGLNPARRSQTCTPGSFEQYVSYRSCTKCPQSAFQHGSMGVGRRSQILARCLQSTLSKPSSWKQSWG